MNEEEALANSYTPRELSNLDFNSRVSNPNKVIPPLVSGVIPSPAPSIKSVGAPIQNTSPAVPKNSKE